MRIFTLSTFCLLLLACGNNPPPGPGDGGTDGGVDGGDLPAGITEARDASDGMGLSRVLNEVVVTSVRSTLGSDVAGFTVQAAQTGPALFIALDPTTVSPPAQPGDAVSFTITAMGTVSGQRRALTLSNYSRVSTGSDLSALTQNVTPATDLVTAGATYDAELVIVTGALSSALAAGGPEFSSVRLDTTGVSGDANLRLRAPSSVFEAADAVTPCVVTATRVPLFFLFGQAQITAMEAGALSLSGCPAPTVVSAVALSPTSVRLTFSRHILASSVAANGSQFTVNNGLNISGASVSGRTVILTTSAQTPLTDYTVTAANTVTDLQGSALSSPTTADFEGHVTRAVLRINELNANIASSCDLIELRVISAGTVDGLRLTERTGNVSSTELSFDFPAVTVQKNDFIVLHLNSGSATCNPGTATGETTSVSAEPASTFGRNYDLAYDLWSSDTGLTVTNNVLTLFDAIGSIMDVVLVADGTGTVASASLTAAGAAGTASQWLPAQATYDAAAFSSAAVTDSDATGTTPAGASLQRLDDSDDNDKADWTTGGGGTTSTFGAKNAGQSDL